jgi:hypothetical protein
MLLIWLFVELKNIKGIAHKWAPTASAGKGLCQPVRHGNAFITQERG